MSTQSGEPLPSVSELVELGPAVVDRIALAARPGLETVAYYVLTRAAERAWQAIEHHLNEPRGGVFWIGGPSGSGKTHFLNYLLALDRSAGSPAGARRLSVGLEAGKDLEARLLEAIARGLALTARDTALWRRMRGADALPLALDHARRQGTQTITVAVDFGAAQSDTGVEYFAALARASESVKQPGLIVIAAGRGEAAGSAAKFEVAPADADELAAAAIGRARRLKPEAKRAIAEFYRAVDTGAFEAGAIFPFHPFSVEVLRALANPPGTIAELARLVRAALAPGGEIRELQYRCLLAPADLLACTAVRARADARLGESGRAALESARQGAAELEDRSLALRIVDTLALAYIADGSQRLSVAQLQALMPAHRSGMLAPAKTATRIGATLTLLAQRTNGIIRFELGSLRFDPRSAGAPEVTAFNAVLPLIRRFDPSITPAQELPELKAKLKRLGDAMANALEAARRTTEILGPVLAGPDGALSQRQSVLPNYMALALAGPAELLETAADSGRRDEALQTVTAYEALAAAAAAAPRVWAMRDYLQATGLRWNYGEDSRKDKKIAALESECQLLASQLTPAVLLDENRNLEALQARFQQLRWSYVQEYRAAHDEWREEMRQLAAIAKDARDYLAASRRLSAIAALGTLEVNGLEAALKELEGRVVPCDFSGPLAPEVSPRCPGCAFVLGTPSPRAELTRLFERIKEALGRQLDALSQTVIARLIRANDRAGRTKGLLEIIQAAQTDKLVRLLDDDLAAYVARLIEEQPAEAEQAPKSVAARRVFRRRAAHPKTGPSKLRP